MKTTLSKSSKRYLLGSTKVLTRECPPHEKLRWNIHEMEHYRLKKWPFSGFFLGPKYLSKSVLRNSALDVMVMYIGSNALYRLIAVHMCDFRISFCIALHTKYLLLKHPPPYPTIVTAYIIMKLLGKQLSPKLSVSATQQTFNDRRLKAYFN